MDGIHDMGGSHDFPASLAERDEGVFHEPWEGRAFVLSATFVMFRYRVGTLKSSCVF